jgi:hypothetical protein
MKLNTVKLEYRAFHGVGPNKVLSASCRKI